MQARDTLVHLLSHPFLSDGISRVSSVNRSSSFLEIRRSPDALYRAQIASFNSTPKCR